MTVAEGIASILLWFTSVGGACALIFWCRRKYRIDALRHRLFVYRDQLFNLALDGALDFNDPAYVILRRKINNMIRFAHKVNLVRAVVLGRFCRGTTFDQRNEILRQEWENAVSALPAGSVQDQVRTIHESMLLEVVKHTTVGWCLWICLVVTSRLSGHRIKNTEQLVQKGSLVEIEARRVEEAREESGLLPAAA